MERNLVIHHKTFSLMIVARKETIPTYFGLFLNAFGEPRSGCLVGNRARSVPPHMKAEEKDTPKLLQIEKMHV